VLPSCIGDSESAWPPMARLNAPIVRDGPTRDIDFVRQHCESPITLTVAGGFGGRASLLLWRNRLGGPIGPITHANQSPNGHSNKHSV
jgi:hypothetical protein